MIEILIILSVIYFVAKISGPSVWKGWTPPRYKPYHGKGLPWFGKRKRTKHEKYYWDD